MMKKMVLLVGIVSFYSVSLAGISYINSGEYQYDVRLYNSDKLIVNGGGADRITISGHSYVDVQYTSTPLSNSSGIGTILIEDSGQLEFLGGMINLISIYDYATATLKGGQINYIKSFQKVINTDPYIDLYCQTGWSWIYNTSGDIKGITGFWENGTGFFIQFLDIVGGPDPVWKNVKVIPEPATMLFVGLGGLLLRRKRS